MTHENSPEAYHVHDKRTVPVRFNDGPHTGLVVMHSPQEYERLTGGIVCPYCGEPITAHRSECETQRPCQDC